MRNLKAEKFIRTAMRKTGLNDWGDWGDNDHYTALNILIESLKHDVNLKFFGRLMVHQVLLRSLENRLLFIEELKKNPDSLKTHLKPMIVIASMPRTGTTLLHRLLTQDPKAIWLPLWLLFKPMPLSYLPINSIKQKIHQRQVRLLLRIIRILMPQLYIKRDIHSDQPEECSYLFMNCLRSFHFPNLWPLEKYIEWLFEQDPIPMYGFYRKNLQLLQLHTIGEHWVLKSAMHFCYLSTLIEMFPEARIIMIHRDPKYVIPSLLSLLSTVYKISCKKIDMTRITALIVRLFLKVSKDVVNTRSMVDSDRFYDIQYSDLIHNPVGEVKQLYEKFDLAWSDKLDWRLKSYMQSNPKGKYGKHIYSLKQFGLLPNDIDDFFLEYTKRFHPSPE